MLREKLDQDNVEDTVKNKLGGDSTFKTNQQWVTSTYCLQMGNTEMELVWSTLHIVSI
jgi:hypothetical protein